MGLSDKIESWLINRWINSQVKEGTVFGKVWTWLDGKKTVIGSAVAVASYLLAGVPVALPLFVKDAAAVAQWSGIALGAVGVIHKAFKFIFKSDAPEL